MLSCNKILILHSVANKICAMILSNTQCIHQLNHLLPSSRKVPGHGFTTEFFDSLRGKRDPFFSKFDIIASFLCFFYFYFLFILGKVLLFIIVLANLLLMLAKKIA